MPALVEPADFAEWTRAAVEPMRRLARRLVPTADADDVVQEALARAWQKRGQFDPARGTSTTWLLAIVADQARTARRTRTRRLRLVDEFATLPDRAVVESGDPGLEQAIDQLTERQQLAVQLYYFVGLTVPETAAVLGCAAGTVKSTLFDARTRLRELLGDDDD